MSSTVQTPSDSPSPIGPRRASLTFIFLTVLFDVIAFGIIGPQWQAADQKNLHERRQQDGEK